MKLTIVSESNSYTLNKHADITIGHNLDTSIEQYVVNVTVNLSCVNNAIKSDSSFSSGYVSKINGVAPDKFYNVLILGDMCTSLVSSEDPDNTLFSDASASLILFDGCEPCTYSCQKIALLNDLIKNLDLWIKGLKDAQLYYLPSAVALWDKRLQLKLSDSSVCGINNTPERNFRKAVKLLYQYKALVYLWNYLAFLKSGTTQILEAALSYAGFVVQSKRAVDTCSDSSTDSIALHISAKLTAGQLPYGTTQDGLKLGLKVFVYVDIVELNTRILYTAASGVHKLKDIQSDSCSVFLLSDSNVNVNVVIPFETMESCKLVYSGGVKILPVIAYLNSVSDSDVYPIENSSKKGSILKNLGKYILLKRDANYIAELLLLLKNIWTVLTWWLYKNTGQTSDSSTVNTTLTKLYTTGYYVYPLEAGNGTGYITD